MTVYMPEKLAAHFSAGIRTNRAGDIVLLAPRDIRVFAIDRRGRCEDELLDALLLGEFEQVLRSDDIGTLITDGVLDRRTDAGLGG